MVAEPVAPAPLPESQPIAVEPLYEPQAVVRPTRMPQIEDFPVVAQQQLRASQTLAPQPMSAETKRMTLLQRLAAVGLGRREEQEAAIPHVTQPVPAEPLVPAIRAETARRPVVQAPQRSAQGQLDSQGRVQHRSIEDDQLEIPAFLRRQVS
jgi:cell division protein FtsZ